ncbi:UNVERIFIED_CONTAM: hypothetical protein FKN15_071340 [Acipenser sinensis]
MSSNQSEPVHSSLPMAPSSSPKSTDQRDTHLVAVTEEDWHATLLAEMTTFPDAEGSSYGPFKEPGLLSLSTAESDTNTSPERPSMDYSAVNESDILLDTVPMVTTVHRRTDSKTPESGPSTTVIHSASSTLIPWNEPAGLTESTEPYFRQEVTTETGSVKTESPQGSPQIGIQNYTSATSCQSRPTQSRSDYGKLFVVLVIIGSICVVIIVSGLIYICWQRRLPKLKNMSHGEELHFVENGCHDNPTLDVTIDSQSEMQEKKPSVNGVVMDGVDNWHILINKTEKEEGDNYEEDTHL